MTDNNQPIQLALGDLTPDQLRAFAVVQQHLEFKAAYLDHMTRIRAINKEPLP